MKALQFESIKSDTTLYVEQGALPRHATQSPAVCAKVGLGSVGYVGDINGEGESRAVLIAMLGLGNVKQLKAIDAPKPKAGPLNPRPSSRPPPSLSSGHEYPSDEEDNQNVALEPGRGNVRSRTLV